MGLKFYESIMGSWVIQWAIAELVLGVYHNEVSTDKGLSLFNYVEDFLDMEQTKPSSREKLKSTFSG